MAEIIERKGPADHAAPALPEKAPKKRRSRKSRRGSGELIKGPGGIWYARYYDGESIRRNRSTSTTHKPDAEKFLSDRVSEAGKERDGRVRKRGGNVAAGDLLPKWLEGLTNRNADDDRARVNRYLVPKWGKVKLSAVDVAALMEWIDELRKSPPPPTGKRGRKPVAGRLAEPTLRHLLNLLSRFFAWAVERGHTNHNPVHDIPRQRRPRATGRTDAPYLDDDTVVRTLVRALPAPIGFVFYLGNRSGLRTGELAGLRLADLGFLETGAIRVRFSYDGPLKEDKAGEGKMKWAPAPADAQELLGGWLDTRRAQGAGPEDLAFPNAAGGMFDKETIGRAWKVATGRRKSRRDTTDTGPEADSPIARLTFYQATRHAFVSRNLSRGASLDEVSSSVGHSSPVVTRRYYDHFVRRTFSDGLRQGLGLTAATGPAAPVHPLHPPGKNENRTKNGTTSEQNSKAPKRRGGRSPRGTVA